MFPKHCGSGRSLLTVYLSVAKWSNQSLQKLGYIPCAVHINWIIVIFLRAASSVPIPAKNCLCEKNFFIPLCLIDLVTDSLEKGLTNVQGLCEHHPALGNAASVLASCSQHYIKGRLSTFSLGFSNKVFQ